MPDTISSSAAYYSNKSEDYGAKISYKKFPHGSSRDTIETEQQRLERNILNQFKRNHEVPPNSKFVLVAQIGRYVVLALILPPYYAVYKGPKYFLIQLEPVLALTAEKMGQVLLLISSIGIDFWAGLGKKLQKPKNFLKKNVERLNKAIQRVQLKLTTRIKEVFQPLNILLHRIHNYTNTFKDKYSKLLTWTRTFALQLPQKLKTALPTLKNALLSNVKELIPAVVKPIKLMQKSIARPFLKVGEAITPVVAFIGTQITRTLKPIKNFSKIAANQARKVLSQVQNIGGHLIQASIVQPIKHVFKAMVKPFNAIKEVTKVLSNAIQERVHTATNALQKVATLAFAPVQGATKTITRFGNETLTRVVEKLKVFTPAIKRVIKALWDHGKRQGNKGYAVLKNVVKATAVSLVWAFEKTKQIPSKLLALLKKLMTWVRQSYRKAIIAGRIVLAWTKILIRYSLEQLWS